MKTAALVALLTAGCTTAQLAIAPLHSSSVCVVIRHFWGLVQVHACRVTQYGATVEVSPKGELKVRGGPAPEPAERARP